MALYTITKDAISPVGLTDFAALGMRERGDLQRLLRSNIEVIAPDTLVIAEEFQNWDNSNRRIDLLAVDSDANLVVIELKRDDGGGHMDLQSLRYAAMVARMTFEMAVNTYEGFLRHQSVGKDARQSLLDFFGWPEPDEDSFARDVRIVLVAADFSDELTSTVLWLSERSLDIRCVRIQPYQLADGVMLLNVEQIIPLPEAADYQIQIRQKKEEERVASRGRRKERAVETLVAKGLLTPGCRIQLVRGPRHLKVAELPETARHATFQDGGHAGVKWDHDQELYSLSSLCKKIGEQFGGIPSGAAYRGPDYWALADRSEPLSEMADSLQREVVPRA